MGAANAYSISLLSKTGEAGQMKAEFCWGIPMAFTVLRNRLVIQNAKWVDVIRTP
jgi:hypothetical protein